MNTPLASKTTVSSRNKMAATGLSNHIHHQSTTSKIPPRTVFKPPLNKAQQQTNANLAATSSRIALSRSRLSSRQSSTTSNAQTTVRKHTNLTGGSIIPTSNYIPDANSIRKGLAKFSNPIECQRQFQALNSKLRELTDINENKEKTIAKLQDQLNDALNQGVGYAIVVQYFSKKLKIDDELDLEKECEQLKSKINHLMINECEFEKKLDSIVNDYKVHLKVEQDLKSGIERELEETRVSHSNELVKLKELHEKHCNNLEVRHSEIKEELEHRIQLLEIDLSARTKELHDLKKDYDSLNISFNKLEESLIRDKDARVKYAQEKANQLQKDVDSLNSVLEMRTERIHALEKDSILLSEVQQELMKTEDNNKALRQQLESLTAALENKRVQYENLLADHEKIAQELKRERKERRRMTMRTEQLEYVLNESCATENNITVLDSSVET